MTDVPGGEFTLTCFFCYSDYGGKALSIDEVPTNAKEAYNDGWRDILLEDGDFGWACDTCYADLEHKIEVEVPLLDELELLDDFVDAAREDWHYGNH